MCSKQNIGRGGAISEKSADRGAREKESRKQRAEKRESRE
jgi:hypothetical protein